MFLNTRPKSLNRQTAAEHSEAGRAACVMQSQQTKCSCLTRQQIGAEEQQAQQKGSREALHCRWPSTSQRDTKMLIVALNIYSCVC